MFYRLSLLIFLSFLSSCAWQNEAIKSYNNDYNCQIDGWYFTKTYTRENINIKDGVAYDKENKPITGAVVSMTEVKDIKICLTGYYKDGERTKFKEVISIRNKPHVICEDEYQKDGTIKYYKNGKYIDYSKRNEDGKSVFYYPNGQVKSIHTRADVKKEDIEIQYYQNGLIERITNYKDNKKNGYTYYYDEQGILTGKEYYKNGKRDGKSYSYYPNGKIEAIDNYKQDKVHNKSIEYYENGSVRLESNCKNGSLHGTSKYYWENGKIAFSGSYVEGMRNGPFRFYDIEGKLIKVINIANGKAVSGYNINNQGNREEFTKEELKLSNYQLSHIGGKVSKYKEYADAINFYKDKDALYKQVSNFNNDKEISNRKFNKMKQVLDDNVKKFKAKSGSFIIMDASDATILSMHTNNENDNEYQLPLPIRFYECGSVLKAFTMAMALESKEFTIKDKIDVSKPLELRYNKVRDYRGVNREISLDEILVYSSNIASAKMALAIGGEYQYHFIKKLGLLDKMDDYGIETQKPLYPDKSRWFSSEASIATIGYGYGMSTSPLHIITAYSAIINGGTYHKPSFKHVDNKEGVRVISNKNSEQMKNFLRLVVTNGSGKRANVDGIEVMGITGTANKLNEKGRYEKGKVMTAFVGNFEYNNKQYAILVILDEPQPIAETYNFNSSGWNAAPTAGALIKEVIDSKN